MLTDLAKTLDAVEGLLRERGELSKEEICLVFALDDGGYATVRDYLAVRKGVKKIGGKTGGLALDRRVGARSGPESILPLSESQRSAVERLVELVDPKALLGLTDERMANELAQEGASPQLSARRAAEVLVLQYDLDLFWFAEARAAVAKAVGIEAPGRWHAGKGAAVQFVNAAGFPIEYAGISSGEKPEAVELVEPYGGLPPLETFQQELQRLILQVLHEKHGRAIASLPTGAGKTRTAVEAVVLWLSGEPRGKGSIVLWLAHTEELCEQACEAFRQVWADSSYAAPLRILRRFGGIKAPASALGDGALPTVVVTTPAALDGVAEANLDDARIDGILSSLPPDTSDVVMQHIRETMKYNAPAVSDESQAFFRTISGTMGAVIIDEAHRSAARGYKQILEWCGITHGEPSIVGLTATPFRSGGVQSDETKELSRLFNENLLEPLELRPDARVALQNRQVLAVPTVRNLTSDTVISSLPTDQFRQDEVMRIWADNRARRRVIVHEIATILDDPLAAVLYFGPSVADARAVALMLRLHGHQAQALSGTTRREVRRSIVQRFRKTELRVLCNCELLTTGFDAPRVSHVVVGRPTTSQVLYEQMVGRGLRGPKFGGTEACTIIDIQDTFAGPKPHLGYEGFREHWKPRMLTLTDAIRPQD